MFVYLAEHRCTTISLAVIDIKVETFIEQSAGLASDISMCYSPTGPCVATSKFIQIETRETDYCLSSLGLPVGERLIETMPIEMSLGRTAAK